MSNAQRIVELRKTAESHRQWANHCLSIERPGWLAAADECDRRADQLQQEEDMTTFTTTVHITNFVRRQTPQSGFSHWEISDLELLARVQAGLPSAKPGYRDGVILVPVSPEGFFTGVCQLQEGDKLVGEYKARKPGEDPRKSSYVVGGKKMPAKSVEVVLYRHDVLAENKENETECEYEIVSVNASPTLEATPIPTGALIANHLQLSGGTSTKMTDAEFVALLRKSVEFWKDKANAAPEGMK